MTIRLRLLATLFLLCVSTAASAAISVDVQKSTDRSTAGSTVASPAFSTAAPNELLLAFVATDGSSTSTTTVSGVSGGGLTWTLVSRANGQSGTAEIWRAFSAGALTNATVTATISRSVVSSITIMSFTGVDTSGTNGSGAVGAVGSANARSGAPSASIVTTRDNSLVIGVGNDWDNAIARTVPAGQALVHQVLSTSGDTYWVQRQINATPTAGSLVTINDTAPTADRFNLAVCELLASGSGTTPTWNISGAVGANGAGAIVTLDGASKSTTADASGNFSFSGVANGSYTVTPTKAGYGFTPANQPVTVNGADLAGINFTAQAVGPASIQLVQKNAAGKETSASAISAAFPSNNIAGDFLVVVGTGARPAVNLTVSDTAGNIYTPVLGPINESIQDVNAYIWYVPSSKGGPNTVTLTASAAAALEIHVSEWSGISATSPVDKIASAVGQGISVSSGAASTSVPGELVLGYTFVGNTATAGAGFTQLTLVNGDLDEFEIQGAAGPVAATFNQASSGAWIALMATFRPAGTSGGTVPTVSLTAPAGGANVLGTTTVSATATDPNGIAAVQFVLDGANLSTPVTTPPYQVSWDTTTTSDGAHTLTAFATNSTGASATSTPVAVTVANGAATTGQWSAPFDLGLVAVNAVMMHTGKVLLYSGAYVSSWVERVWDPITGNSTLVPNPYYDLFCSGQSQLADGRILIVGGFDSATLGAANANIFDPVTETWSAVSNMAYRRWYPTATTLPDGKVLVTSGGQTCLTCLADLPEVFDPATGHFSTITTARLAVPYYPFMFVLPDGSVVDAGANEETVATSKLNLAAGTWTTVDAAVKDGHSAAMYLPGKILKSGTAADSGTLGNAAATAFVIDMNQPSPAWRQVASMAHPRAFHNTTLLPDGSVLVTGGGTTLDGHNVSKAVLAPELWSPATETWRTLASASVPRLYHSVALLLPDGRVLNAGGGNDSGATDETQGQIFSPPYLFKGARPVIAAAPDTLQYGAPFTISTPDATTIASVVLIRPGAVTHAFDEDQRFVPLTFSPASGALTVQAPANANLAPPGYYMLFIVNSNGVPSVSTFVRFGAPAGDTTPPTSPTNLSGAGAVGTAALSWSAATDDTGVSQYNVYRSTSSGFQPSAANRIGQSLTTQFTDTTSGAGTFFYVVTAQDVAGNISAPSNEAGVTVLGDTTPPSVTITAPAELATLSGSVTLSANASDEVGVAGVQFELDGGALGTERTSPPYSMIWNSATAANGPHIISAVARDAAGNRSQASVDVSVSNNSSTPSGLVAAYGFNEGAGVLANDSSGQGNTGTIASATWSTAGKFGGALSFNGTSAWVTVADANTLDLTKGMTLEAWVNPSSGSGWRAVIEKETPGGLAYALYSANNASRPAGYVHTSADMPVTGTAAVSLNVWTHLALTYDGTTLRMYVNGALVRSSSAPGSIGVSGSALRIGGDSVWGEYFRGLIDEVRIYNRALSAGEIQSDMGTPVP